MFSSKATDSLHRCYSYKFSEFMQLPEDSKSVLQQLLLEGPVPMLPSALPPHVSFLIQCGVANIHAIDNAFMLVFSAPAAQRVVFQSLFLRSKNMDTSRLTNIDDWLLQVFQLMSSSKLSSFTQGSSLIGVPKEQAYQQEFYACACACLPPTIVIVPEISAMFAESGMCCFIYEWGCMRINGSSIET
jgi:hypothetical protein